MDPYYRDMFAFIGVGIVAYKCAQLVVRALFVWQLARSNRMLERVITDAHTKQVR